MKLKKNANDEHTSHREQGHFVHQRPGHRGGFTLIELLVVIAIVAVLAGLMLPVLAKAKQQSQGIKCVSNLRQLTLAWTTYATDNGDYFAVNGGTNYQPAGTSEGPDPAGDPQWCPGQMDQRAAVIGEQTNAAWVAAGVIYPYAGSTAVYHCPGDVSSFSGSTVFPNGGGGAARVRSVSMNAWVSPADIEVQNCGMSGTFRIFYKVSDLAVPGPGNLWLLMDENPYTIATGFNLNFPNETQWNSIPASYHNHTGGITFCDGHAEMRKWSDPAVVNVLSQSPAPDASALSDDFLWLAQRTTIGL